MTPAPLPAGTGPTKVPSSRAGILLALLAIPLAGAGQAWLVSGRSGLASAAWGAAIGVFVLALWRGRAAAALPATSEETMPPAVEKVLLSLVLLLGAFFLVHRLAELPAGLNHDAAFEGLYALSILDGVPYTPYTDVAWGRETLTFYFRAVSIGLLGPTLLAVVAPSVVAGFLVLPPFFAWARRTLGSRFALLGTLLLAVSGWHLVFSRTGWRSDFQPLFMVLACASFARGVDTGRRLPFAASGLFLAATLNTYNASRVFPLFFAYWLAEVVLASREPLRTLRRLRSGLFAMGAAFAVAIAPLAVWAVSHWETFQGRASALRGAVPFVEALQTSLLLFNHRGNGDDFFVDTPGLEAPVAVFFVFGVLWALWNANDSRARLLLFGLALNLVPGLVSKPNLNRCIGTMPFVYLLAALGVLFFVVRLDRLRRDGAPSRAGILLVVVVVCSATVATYRQYLGSSRRSIPGYYPETTVLGRTLRGLVPGYTVYVGGANFPRDTLTYLTYTGGGEPLRRRYVWVEEVAAFDRERIPVESGKGLAIVLATEGESGDVLERLASRLRVRRTAEIRYPAREGTVFARALFLSQEDVARAGKAVRAVETLPESFPAPLASHRFLKEPRGVGASSDGSLFVCDFGNSRIVELDADLDLERPIGRPGGAAGEFRQPGGITVDGEGHLVVADTWNHRVQVLSREGVAIRTLTDDFWGPRGVAVDAAGTIYVSDTGRSRIVAFPRSGGRPRAWGVEGSGPGELRGAVGLALDAEERLFVADAGNGRVQVFATDGRLVGGFPVPGWSSSEVSEPHLAVGPLGLLWLTVPTAGQIRAYAPDGRLLHTIRDNLAGGPSGIAILRGREVIVSTLGGEMHRHPLPDLREPAVPKAR